MTKPTGDADARPILIDLGKIKGKVVRQFREGRGELVGVPKGRTGIGLRLTGGRTAQAWARKHRHLRNLLTPLVEERVGPDQPPEYHDDESSGW